MQNQIAIPANRLYRTYLFIRESWRVVGKDIILLAAIIAEIQKLNMESDPLMESPPPVAIEEVFRVLKSRSAIAIINKEKITFNSAIAKRIDKKVHLLLQTASKASRGYLRSHKECYWHYVGNEIPDWDIENVA